MQYQNHTKWTIKLGSYLRYLISICFILSPSLSFAETMICTTYEYIGFTPEKGFENYEIKADDKTYISITDKILAMNTSDTAAKLFEQNSTYSSEILGLVNRKFVMTNEFATEVVIVDGKECFYGDKETKMVNRSTTFENAVYAQMLSCTCN